jgi:isopenicillin-N N-acyltransferase like protein
VSSACTLWGAAGIDANGGTILSKNRDWKPDHAQTLELRRNKTGFAYFGLYAVGNNAEGLKQGVNEKGLTVVTATAGAIPKAAREAEQGKGGLMTTLLRHYVTCDQILADKEKLFSNRKPSFLMISDRKKLLVIEVALKGRYAVKVVESGVTAHSNHFLDASLSDCNLKLGESSATRVVRITELLENAPRPLNTTAFAAMSRDHHNGVNNSLWRTGSESATLSSWIVETPRSGAAKLRVLLANPGRPEQTNIFVLDDKFWNDFALSRSDHVTGSPTQR